jgi:hypothetical protein
MAATDSSLRTDLEWLSRLPGGGDATTLSVIANTILTPAVHRKGKQKPKRANVELESIRKTIREIGSEAQREGEKLTARELCERLDARQISQPANSRWSGKSWVDSYSKKRGNVEKWLSENRS